ncbi:hypothetical protein SDC9_140918 [bioreactor metagenome]|uniref:Gamma-glutamylcyclotransferase AIG2-like domain-containing protein n=1 Tax=bioreactor metagenome TaxID=1076179 RepID=A0A645DWR1_9ZZZZ
MEAAARLSGWRLEFFGHSRVWDGALETALPDPEGELWGVVYHLGFRDRECLDRRQDARFDGSGVYFHYPVTVSTDGNRIFSAVMYRKDQLGEPRPPSCEYRDFIAQGAEIRGLPPDYCAELRRIPAVPAGYAVPREKSSGELPETGGDCALCGSAS